MDWNKSQDCDTSSELRISPTTIAGNIINIIIICIVIATVLPRQPACCVTLEGGQSVASLGVLLFTVMFLASSSCLLYSACCPMYSSQESSDPMLSSITGVDDLDGYDSSRGRKRVDEKCSFLVERIPLAYVNITYSYLQTAIVTLTVKPSLTKLANTQR